MSRIGNRVLTIPTGVDVQLASTPTSTTVTVKGPKGELKQQFNPLITVKVADGHLSTLRPNDHKHTKQLHGTTNALIKAMLEGVVHEFTAYLTLVGVGYRAKQQGLHLVLNLGYSNPVEYLIPDQITITCPSLTEIKVSGIDKQKVMQTAAEIRSFRPPEPYKGKGIRYRDEIVRRKEGKAAGK